MFRHKLYVPNLILIVICIVVLLAIYLLNTLGNNKTDKTSLFQIREQDSVIHYLQKSKDDLYRSENAYHFYLGTNDSQYKEEFIGHLEAFVEDIDRSNILDESDSSRLFINIQQKVYLANAVIRLKNFADNILLTSLRDSAFNEDGYIDLRRNPASRVIKKYVTHQSDTIKYVPVKQKKNFIKKIASLFKEEKDSTTAVASGSSHEYTSEDSIKLAQLSQKNKLSSIDRSLRNYYRNVLKQELYIRKKIDENNKLAALNNQYIFTEVQDEITKVLRQANNSRQTNTYTTIENLQNSYFDQNTVFIISLSVISILILMLGYKVVAAREYEKNIISDKQQAVALSEMKASFLNTMSHEIRTPLTAIIGFADHIHTRGIDKNTSEYIQHIKYASDHLLETVNDVLEFSKLESGNVTVADDPFIVQELLESTVNTYKLQAEKKNLQLILRSTIEPSLTVNGDAFHLRQILYNLINNAIKFTDNGSITLSVSQTVKNKTAELKFIVEDTGRGISQEGIDKVFKEFVQIKDRTKKDSTTQGTGLGLSITQKLVTLLGGTISLASELGKGSRFTVTIPFDINEENKKHIAVKTVDNTQLKGKRILLAEDSEPIIYLAKTILNEMDIEVTIARNGEEAWELFQSDKERFDYILTDIEMPKLNGNTLAKRIREHKSTIPIIAMTAHTSQEAYEKYKLDGVDAVITKPFKKSELNIVLSQYL